jgi:hypothetical protein
MFNLEGLIPKLCQLAQEAGNNERTLRLRSAGLQVLGSMVQFLLPVQMSLVKELPPKGVFVIFLCFSNHMNCCCF